MKKVLIILGGLIAIVLVSVYLAFLFVLPRVVILDKYKPIVQKLVKDQIPLNLDYKNPKVVTNGMLSIGVKIDDISLIFEDGTPLFKADRAKFTVAIPSIFAFTVKIPTAQIDNPYLNFEIVDGKQFKLLLIIQDLLNGKEEAANSVLKEEKKAEVAQRAMMFNPNWIRIKVPNIVLNNYKVLLNDTKSNHRLTLQGEKMKLGYFNGKVVKLKTNAEILSDEDKNITLNVDINTFLPPFEALDEEDDKPELVILPFVNPVTTYREYNLKSKLSTKLKIRQNKGITKINGFFNVDDTTLNLSGYQLPSCYFHGKFAGLKSNIDTNISVTKTQNIKLLGDFDYGKNPKIDMILNTDKIYIQDILNFAKALLDSLHIRNDIAMFRGKGYISANTTVKTNLKKIKSDGAILVCDGELINKTLNLGITKINLSFIFDDNSLNIVNSSLFINNAPLKLMGKIDKSSIADLKIETKDIPITGLYRAFAPMDLKRSILIDSGKLTLNAKMTGKLKSAISDIDASLKDFSLRDNKNTFRVINDKLILRLSADNEHLKAQIKDDNLYIDLPSINSRIFDNAIKLNIDDKKIILLPTILKINSNSNLKLNGYIDSDSESSLDLKIDGIMNAVDLKQFAGQDAAMFIDAKGNIPVSATLKGDLKRQTLLFRAMQNAGNYITPIHFQQLLGKTTLLQSRINLKGDRLKIKDTGLFIRTTSTDDEGKTIEHLEEIVGLNGTVANLNKAPFINVINVRIPKSLKGSIHAFNDSSFELDDSRIKIFGKTESPRYRGVLRISNVNINDLYFKLSEAFIAFRGKVMHVALKNIDLNGSDLETQFDVSLVPSPILNVSRLRVASRNLDLDRLMKVSDAANKTFAKSGVSSSSQPANANIPVSVTDGTIDLRRIKTGDIVLRNTIGNVVIYRNNLYLTNMNTRAFDGSMNGAISMNLLNSFVRINVNGRNIDIDNMLVKTANMKDTLTGKMDFRTNLMIDGAASSYEKQMKSLRGDINFVVKNGQFGPFGKVENMILAENIRNSQFFQTALGGVVKGLTSIDTTHFEKINGLLTFNDGIVTLKPVTTEGNVLTLHIAGDFDLLKDECNMKVRGRLGSMIANVLGPIANVNPINLVKITPGLNVASAKMFSLFTQPITLEELNSIPKFDTKTENLNATNFQIVVAGDVNKPLKLVKSFKWLALSEDISRASAFVATLPEPETLDSTVESIQAQQVKDAKVSSKIKNFFFKKEKHEKEATKLETQRILRQMQDGSVESQSNTEKSDEQL